MSAQIETPKSHFVRFPDLNAEQAKRLARAIDFEASAGRAVKHGQLAEAEHLRAQARSAWNQYREVAASGAPGAAA